MSNNIADSICESVKIIGESLLEGLQYDQTIECTIIDDSKKDQGIYRVSNGSSSFLAYSSEKYTNNMSVYVTIPNGDYNNNKWIMGRKIKSEEEPLTYVAPFDNLLDITNNLVPDEIYNATYGLTANRPDKTKIEIFKLTNLNYSDFTRLGLSAAFQSWLMEYDCVAGDYGLELAVEFKKTNIITDIETDKTEIEEVNYVKYLYLNTKDMIGNPYQFESFYSQEKLFDISDLGAVVGITGSFFQKAGSFKNKKNELIPYKEADFEDFDDAYLLPNLFIQNCTVLIGYDINEQVGDFVQLFTLDPMSYTAQTDDQTINTKIIELRWLHENSDGKKYPILENSIEEFEVRWYRYKLGNPSPDDFAGINWIWIQEDSEDKNLVLNTTAGLAGRRFSTILYPDITLSQEQVKAIILYGKAPGYYPYLKLTKEEFESNPTEYYIQKGTKYEQCTWKTEFNSSVTYYYKEVEQREIYRSNIITFINEVDVPSKATLNAMSALSLICMDSIDDKLLTSYGNYLLYDEMHNLIDKSQANIERLIGCQLLLDGKDAPEDLTKAYSITWKFPISNTMIKPTVGSYSNEYISVGQITESLFKYNNYYIFDEENSEYIKAETYNSTQNYYMQSPYAFITIENAEDIQNDIQKYGYPVFSYFINSRYSMTNTNNNIECVVNFNGVEYSATQELTFGQAGTMGSDWTFILDFANDQTAMTVDTGYQQDIIARLYDINNQEIDISGYGIDWAWFKSPFKSPDIQTIDLTRKGNIVTLTALAGLEMSHIYILQATLTGFGDYDLIAYLPIPLRYLHSGEEESKYLYITGADKIIYLSDGTPEYYKDKYILHRATTDIADGHQTSEALLGDEWILIASEEATEESNESSYWPAIKNNRGNGEYKLIPSPLYFNGLDTAFAVQCIIDDIAVWTQPILIIQNQYFSSMINKWDGKSIDLNEEEGSILANMIGAGRKNGDNQFSGVLMGDWSQNAASMPNTGLYGFQNGVMTFGFKDDGTAFIGSKSRAQIQFDGNKGSIQSASYREGQGGMYIDLDDGFINIKSVNGSLDNGYQPLGNVEIELNANPPTDNDAYFKINVSGTDLIHIDDNDYYLRSLNYESQKSGMKIDLNEGFIDAYNFYLQSKNVIIHSIDSEQIPIDRPTKISWFKILGDEYLYQNGLIEIERQPILMDVGYELYYASEGILGVRDNYYLQSAAYDLSQGKSGIRIDLSDIGKITAYNFELQSTNIIMNSSQTTSEYFIIKNNAQEELMYVGNPESENYQFYLQSSPNDENGYMKIDLANCSISGSKFSLSGSSSDNSTSITITSGPLFNVTINDVTIIDINESVFVLRSKNWSNSTTSSSISTYTYRVAGGGIGVNVFNSNGTKIGAIPDGWTVTVTSQPVANGSGRMQYTSTNCPNVPSSGWITNNAKWYKAISTSTTSTNVSSGTGTQIDLIDGSIMMFGPSVYNKLLIDSQASEYPFEISNFKVDWSGNVKFGDLNISGAITSDLAVDGLIVANGGLTIPAGQILTVNGATIGVYATLA